MADSRDVKEQTDKERSLEAGGVQAPLGLGVRSRAREELNQQVKERPGQAA